MFALADRMKLVSESITLADVVVKHPNVMVFSDEIYEKLIYDGLQFVSFASLDERLLDQTLTFNCHSKSFAMTGWRVGYIGGPKPVIDAISFSSALLESDHVAVVPGNDSGFDTHVRLSFATSLEQIDKGIDRIAGFLKKLA
jgi:aspartate/methionine/tyrosine aminotransferase